ncbi:MAG: NADH-quinone oxidoreductase subunit B [Chloroflexi bacterium]|nr:NADH-quinone oxidoreductase subunit B [Chloroflexota bacterium]
MEIEKATSLDLNRYIYPERELDLAEGQTIEELKARCQTPIPDPDRWLSEDISHNIMLTSIEAVVNWSRKSALWPVLCFPACCAFELMATAASRFDISRFGMEVMRSSPRQADLMITAGTLSWKMAPQVKRIYDQMAEPKWVIAMGACGISGGVFQGSYNVVPGYNRIIPVDVYLPGCPPRPEALLYAIEMLRKKIDKRHVIENGHGQNPPQSDEGQK